MTSKFAPPVVQGLLTLPTLDQLFFLPWFASIPCSEKTLVLSRVDVIVPCYKYGRFLRGCVQSVLAQQGADVRVLILDDTSPDETEEVAAQLVREDGRVSYRRHPSNRGHVATYNEGLDWATGDYTVILSADDLL